MTQPHHTLSGILCVIALVLSAHTSTLGPLHAAPLHPRFFGDPTVRVPAEEPAPAGVLSAAATRFGRRWTGHPRLLVLLVDFSDRPADTLSHPVTYFDRLLFSQGEVATGSLREWYEEATYGKIEWSGEAVGWFRMPLTYAEYANDQSGLCTCYPLNAGGMVYHAFQAATGAGVDFRRFDNDGPDGIPGSGDDDGIVDGFAVVFAGIGAERSGLTTDIRSHYTNAPLELVANGIRVPDYVTFPEKENIGVPVHEVGHLLGAVDLYDLTGRAAGLGYYSVMAYGMWFNNARQPGGPDPYTRMLWGVLEPEALQVDERGLELPPIENTPRALRLWTRGEHGPEYFLLEHRTTEGMDRFLFGDGLLLYHVDERVVAQNNGHHYRVDVVQADGLATLNGFGTVRNLGEFGDYFPGLDTVRAIDDRTLPSTRSSAGESTAVALRNIGDPGPNISFDAEVGRFLGTAPDPHLHIEPVGDLFTSGVKPGELSRVRLLVMNRGTRLPAGTARVRSRDPHLRVVGTSDLAGPSIGALDRRSLGEVEVDVSGIQDDAPVTVPLEVEWSTPETTWTLAAALPLFGNTLRREGFESAVLDVASQSLVQAPDPWRLVSDSYEGSRAWQTLHYDGSQEAVLEVGPVTVRGRASELRFHQKLSLPVSGRYTYDGGFLEASVDGGSWTLLHPEGDYPLVFGYSDGNPYPNHPAWGGQADWHEVVVPFNLRGQVRFRFHFVSDFSGNQGLYDGWAVDALLVRSWDHAYAVDFELPTYSEKTAAITFDVLPLFDRESAEELRLIRDADGGDVEVGRWTVDGHLRQTVELDDLNPLRVERIWVEWSDGDRQGPLIVAPPGAPHARLLDPTPAILRRGEGGVIWYRVPGATSASVLLEVYDVRGARVARLEEGLRTAGSHVHSGFPERDLKHPLGTGLYFLKLTGPGFSDTRRIIILPR